MPDHCLKHITHRQRLFAFERGLPAQIIGDRKDAAEVVRRVSPFGRKPGVVEVEPAIHRANVEGSHDGLEFVGRAGHAGTTGKVAPGTTGPSNLVQAG